MNDFENPTPDERPADPEPADPRLREVDGDEGMPAEFIDTSANRPGDQSPPSPATTDD